MKIYILIPLLLGLALLGLFFLVAPGESPETVRSEKLKVATSFYPLYFMSSQIGGDKAEVANIVPAGAEPHDYEPTAQDMIKIEKSGLIILNGGGLEPWSNDLAKNIETDKIILVSESLMTLRVTENGETGTDPHVWLDPVLAGMMVDRIARGFERADPENKDYYNANAAALNAKLSALDALYRQGLADCAENSIITSHAAFGYLASSYKLNQAFIAGLSPDAEPSPRQLADVVRFARDNKVKFIFFESLVSPKLSEMIADEVGAETLVLNPIEGLSDEQADEGQDYFTLMRDNLFNLKLALQCK